MMCDAAQISAQLSRIVIQCDPDQCDLPITDYNNDSIHI